MRTQSFRTSVGQICGADDLELVACLRDSTHNHSCGAECLPRALDDRVGDGISRRSDGKLGAELLKLLGARTRLTFPVLGPCRRVSRRNRGAQRDSELFVLRLELRSQRFQLSILLFARLMRCGLGDELSRFFLSRFALGEIARDLRESDERPILIAKRSDDDVRPEPRAVFLKL